MTEQKYEDAHIVKLANGEDIICTILDSGDNNSIKILSPLRMQVFTRPTKDGIVESMSLSRWMEPFSEGSEYFIAKNNIITLAPASFAMKRYYAYMLITAKEHLTDIPEIPKTKEENVRTVEERLKVLQEYVRSVTGDDTTDEDWSEEDLFDEYDFDNTTVH